MATAKTGDVKTETPSKRVQTAYPRPGVRRETTSADSAHYRESSNIPINRQADLGKPNGEEK